MSVATLALFWPLDPEDKAKYNPGNQKLPEEIVPPEKWPFEGEDPSLRLPMDFTKGEWTYRCLDRNEDSALIEKSKIYDEATGAMCTGYEVVKIRQRKKERRLPSGTVIRKGQAYYPSDEDFGTYGFAHSTLERAMAKFLSVSGNGEV